MFPNHFWVRNCFYWHVILGPSYKDMHSFDLKFKQVWEYVVCGIKYIWLIFNALFVSNFFRTFSMNFLFPDLIFLYSLSLFLVFLFEWGMLNSSIMFRFIFPLVIVFSQSIFAIKNWIFTPHIIPYGYLLYPKL